jgi:4-hydroxy-3-methylbut-2-en-1-yl diphosphate reductase
MTEPATKPAALTGANSVVGKPDPTGIYRHGFGLKSAVQDDISQDYRCDVVDFLRASDFSVQFDDRFEIHLAKEFGFCYGVDKAIDYAYQTRRMFPGKRIFLTTEIIHNPRVNRRLLEMGIGFLSGQYKDSTGFEDVTTEDVVILPAFGASVQEVNVLRKRGCMIVDTTCGSVIHVWKRVEKYAKEGFTAVIHGKYTHEETIGTSSRVTQFDGGHYVVVRDKDEAEIVCDFIRGKLPASLIQEKFARAISQGFDAETHLQRAGVANQTTMLSSESLEIADMLKQAMIDRYGEENVGDHFRSFDTICSATQERQDAVQAMVQQNLDLILVVGGFNSSNTTHLIEIANHHTRAYHIEGVNHIVSAEEILHKPWDSKTVESAKGWLAPLPLRVGFTAGASTPNRAVGEVIEKVAELCGYGTVLRQLYGQPTTT